MARCQLWFASIDRALRDSLVIKNHSQQDSNLRGPLPFILPPPDISAMVLMTFGWTDRTCDLCPGRRRIRELVL